MTDFDAVLAALASQRFRFTLLADGSGVLFDSESIKIASLNDTSAFIVAMMAAGARSVSEIAGGLTEAFEVDRESAQRDVESLLESLAALVKNPRREPRPDL